MTLEEFADHLPVRRQSDGGRLFAGDADAVMHGGGDVGGRDGIVVRVLAAAVAGADDSAAADAAACDQGAVTMLPVFAAGLVVDPGRAAELTERDDQGGLQ